MAGHVNCLARNEKGAGWVEVSGGSLLRALTSSPVPPQGGRWLEALSRVMRIYTRGVTPSTLGRRYQLAAQ